MSTQCIFRCLSYSLISLLRINHRLHSMHLIGVDIFLTLFDIVIFNCWYFEQYSLLHSTNRILTFDCLQPFILFENAVLYMVRCLLLEFDWWSTSKDWEYCGKGFMLNYSWSSFEECFVRFSYSWSVVKNLEGLGWIAETSILFI